MANQPNSKPRTPNPENDEFVLDRARIDSIRDMLLIGLASYGEIERLDNARKLFEIGGKKCPADLAARHPTGTAETVGDFADALRSLEYALPLERKP